MGLTKVKLTSKINPKATEQLRKISNHNRFGLVSQARVRIWPYVIMTVLAILILSGRLAQLTLVEGVYQRQQADNNRVAAIRTTAVRGIFFDRHGTPLVRNLPWYKRQVPGTTVHEAKFEPIDREQALKLQFQDGGRVYLDIQREYPYGQAMAHLLGYTGEITKEEMAVKTEAYVYGDRIGKSGLEKVYENRLKGKAGSALMEVNAKGEIIRTVGKVDEIRGEDVKLTIDTGLQQVLYEALGDFQGAAVASIPQTGEILALVSKPAYDPNDLGSSVNQPDNPFFNRAIAGVYAPGSVFKPITAIAGLEEGKIAKESQIEDTGEIKIDNYRFGNWYFDEYGRTEGAVDVIKALARSNDIFFYKVGEMTGAEKIKEWANVFGYGQTGNLAPLGEAKGLIPDPDWKSKYKGERWFLGNTYHMAIGQGDVLVTPLQVNRMTGALGARGRLCPAIIDSQEVGKKGCQQLNLKQETIELVHEGMVKACQSGGTGVAFFNYSVTVACKTGTAQEGGSTTNPHAWFTVYAPADNPTIALTVLVENGGQGSEVASPIAKRGLDYWLGIAVANQ